MSGAIDRRARTVLVTGAAGFIGSALCQRLAATGDQVVGYDNLSRGRREHLPNAVRLVEGDIRDSASLEAAVSETRPDCVIHLAAMHFVPECIANPRQTLEVNVEGTRRLLDCCKRNSVGRFIFASSGAVYAPTDGPCVEDTTPLAPVEVYGESKVLAEQLVGAFQAETGASAVVLRFFNAVGRRETNPHVIPHIFESLQTSDVIALGDTRPRRDYVDTRDMAEAVLAASDGPSGLQVLNVGTGAAHSVDDILASLRRILGREIVVERQASRLRPIERMLLVADIGKMHRATGWTPRFGLEDTLRDLVSAYRL